MSSVESEISESKGNGLTKTQCVITITVAFFGWFWLVANLGRRKNEVYYNHARRSVMMRFAYVQVWL